jgi:hypothetical protein
VRIALPALCIRSKQIRQRQAANSKSTDPERFTS